MTGTCPYCGAPFIGSGPRCPTRPSVDHIMPRARRRVLGLPAVEAANTRTVHAECNTLRQLAGECVGALACAFAVADDFMVVNRRRKVHEILLFWPRWRFVSNTPERRS